MRLEVTSAADIAHELHSHEDTAHILGGGPAPLANVDRLFGDEGDAQPPGRVVDLYSERPGHQQYGQQIFPS